MSTPEILKDLCIDELKDLWSANDQKALSVAVKDMYRGDEYLSKLAETTVNVDAMDK